MTSTFRALPKVLTALAVMIAPSGCGSAGSTNNDQGTSFTNIGYFQAGSSDDSNGLAGSIIALGTDRAFITAENTGGETVLLEGQILTAAMGLTNRLRADTNQLADESGNFIQVTKIDCRYQVPGADPSLDIPTDTNFVGGLVEPGDQLFVTFPIITPDLFAFLNASRNSLPEFPFRMFLACSATGVTRAGDTITTNESNFLVVVSDQAECCTGEGITSDGGFSGGSGIQEGPGTGGTVDTFGGEDTTTTGGTTTGTTTAEVTEEETE